MCQTIESKELTITYSDKAFSLFVQIAIDGLIEMNGKKRRSHTNTFLCLYFCHHTFIH